ncbi:extracellular serine-rich protein [Cladophialophora carrionii]|uniref:Extracellular serine-rich protein n=1 Tax=Cladophialophora carrionii TaxID=86049 RepID=A0A1C1CP35_9EURO|nr:extracellular serine-rich protein [Cladophialophora carrionii]
MRSYALLSLGAVASVAHAATFDVDAGEKGLSFEPDTITAAMGDTVNVHFYPGGHTATQSTFDDPCSPMSGGINSGVVNSNSGQASQMFSFQVNTTDPIWMYCGAPGHCAAGMAFVVNPPASGNTLAAYQSASSGKSGSAPSAVSGGVLVANVENADNDDDTSSSSSSSASATQSSGTATGTVAAATTTSASGTAPAAQTPSSAASSNFGAVPLLLLAPVAAYMLS